MRCGVVWCPVEGAGWLVMPSSSVWVVVLFPLWEWWCLHPASSTLLGGGAFTLLSFWRGALFFLLLMFLNCSFLFEKKFPFSVWWYFLFLSISLLFTFISVPVLFFSLYFFFVAKKVVRVPSFCSCFCPFFGLFLIFSFPLYLLRHHRGAFPPNTFQWWCFLFSSFLGNGAPFPPPLFWVVVLSLLRVGSGSAVSFWAGTALSLSPFEGSCFPPSTLLGGGGFSPHFLRGGACPLPLESWNLNLLWKKKTPIKCWVLRLSPSLLVGGPPPPPPPRLGWWCYFTPSFFDVELKHNTRCLKRSCHRVGIKYSINLITFCSRMERTTTQRRRSVSRTSPKEDEENHPKRGGGEFTAIKGRVGKQHHPKEQEGKHHHSQRYCGEAPPPSFVWWCSPHPPPPPSSRMKQTFSSYLNCPFQGMLPWSSFSVAVVFLTKPNTQHNTRHTPQHQTRSINNTNHWL